MIKRRIGFSGVLSSFNGFSRTNPWNKYDFFFQYLRPISSNEASLNHVRTSAKIGHDSPHISTHGTCTVVFLLSVWPLMPANSKLIILRSTQKNVFFGSASGKKRIRAVAPSSIFQCA